MTVRIALGYNRYALIDHEDLERVVEYRWYYSYKGKHVRATVSMGKGSNKFKTVLLHRFIMNAPDDLQVDHINEDVLDNRKQNLRLCTHGENGQNRGKQKNGKNPYKGITQNPNSKRWMAHIGYNKKHYYLGTYATPEEAARAYNEAALKHHGAFAKLNVIPE
jgi:hypothetical protein